MEIIYKLKISDNILSDLLENYRNKIIIFEEDVYEELKNMGNIPRVDKKIIPIIKLKKIFYDDSFKNIYIGYVSVDEKFCIVCSKIKNKKYLLKMIKYTNVAKKIEIEYKGNTFFEIISMILVK